MRIFKLIGMALSAIIIGVNFTACSNDNEPSTADNVPATQKYIEYRSYTYSSDYGDRIESAELSYDGKNRLISITEEDNSRYYTIDYSSCTITASSLYGDKNQVYTFKLNDKGYITELSSEESLNDIKRNHETKFTYDSEGHLIKSVCETIVKQENNEAPHIDEPLLFSEQTDAYITTTNHEWKNGNLTSSKTTETENGSLYSKRNIYYQYTNISNKGNIQPCSSCCDSGLFAIVGDDIPDLLMSCCLFGKLSKDLPSVISIQDYNGAIHSNSYSYSFDYILDKNGFITSSTCYGNEKVIEKGTFIYKN